MKIIMQFSSGYNLVLLDEIRISKYITNEIN